VIKRTKKFLKDVTGSFFGNFSKDIGIDLGTANTLVYVKGKGIVINEPSVVAINKKTNQVLAIGREAKRMVGKTPGHIVARRPLVDGVVSDFEVTEQMLKYFIDKVHRDSFSLFPRPRVVIGVPSDVTEVERRAVIDATMNAGAREVYLIDEPMAAAIGARLPVQEAAGNMVVDIGGGTTDIAVISLGGVVSSRNLRIAGDEMNEDIVRYCRDEFNLLVGEKTAEDTKIAIGSAYPLKEKMQKQIRGRDLVSGLPKEVTIIPEGDMKYQAEAFGSMGIAFLASILFVYLIMVALYDSYLYPFVVLFSIPLAIIGALLALGLTMQSLTIFSILGMIMLVGLVGKNAILLVDFTNQMKAEGHKTYEALILAGKVRMRPILMTTFSMIFGMLPIALASGAGSEWKNGMAWALIGGLTSSLFLTLLVVPVVYQIFDTIKAKLTRKKGPL